MSIQIPKEITLTEGEIPIWYGQMSWASMWLILLFAGICLLTIFLIPLTIICVIFAWVEVSSSEYFVSNKRIYVKRGLLSRTVKDIKIEWITNLSFQQGIFGRILNFGNIAISSPGEHGGTIGFMGVSDSLKVKAIIEDTLSKNKKQS